MGNNFEKLLGKNGELMEERKKQALAGAVGIIRQHYKDKPNKMEMVAKLFGKELGKEFVVNVPQYDVYGEIKDTVPVKGWFDSRGFRSEQIMFADPYIFAELLEGKAVIVDAPKSNGQ